MNLPERYSKSTKFLERALRSIPLGSQTFSKSKTQFPEGVSPLFISRARGSHAWDLDGNEYIDFINSLAAVTLGYNDPDVMQAVKLQLEEGVIYSLPHPLETEVAELMIDMIPCAEKVRFGKNGSDATAGAIRVARAATGRDHVAVCGYHGWQDWYIGSTPRNKGVPDATAKLSHAFTYNNIDSLDALFKSWPGQIAAVIMEPMNVTYPIPGFLENVKEMAHKNGAIFIFDETVTGFRFANGGAQEFFNVTPDMATFGKGLANGYPLSAVVGRSDLMKQMEDVFFSFTFGGEMLSLAAAKATMEKLRREPVVETLKQRGETVLTGVAKAIKKHGAEKCFSVSGHPAWSFMLINDLGGFTSWQIKTFYLQEIFSRGILSIGSHNMSYAHSDADIERLLKVYDEVLPLVMSAIQEKKLTKELQCKPLEPLFKLRG